MTHNSKISARIFIQNSGKEGNKQTVPLPPPKNQTEERDKFFGHRVGLHLAVLAVLGSRIDTPALPPKIQFFWEEICPPEFLLPSSRRLFWAPFFRARPHAASASARHKETTTFTSHLSLTSKSSKILCGGMLQRNPMNTGTDSMNSTECGFSATGVS